MMKITQKLVENLQVPERGQVILRDSELKGFALRCTPGGLSFIVEARVNGKSRRRTIGRGDLLSVSQARQEAIKLLAEMATGKDPAEEKRRAQNGLVTLGQVLDDYLMLHELRQNTQRAYRSLLKQRLGDWLKCPVASISRQMIEERYWYISNLGSPWKASPVQANMTMRVLRLLLNFASRRYIRPDGSPVVIANPVQALSKHWNRENIRQRIVPDSKLNDFYRAVKALKSENVRDYLLLVLMTGMRRNEALSLTWQDLDFQERVLRIRAEISKNHAEHCLPMSDFVWDLLRRRKDKSESTWVFPGKSGRIVQVAEPIAWVRKRAGIDFSSHDLRRTFLTMAEREGIPYHLIKRMANHKSKPGMTSRYLVVNAERLREPMERVSRRLLALMQKEQTLKEAIEEYILSHDLSLRTKTAYKRLLEQKTGDWLNLPLASISLEMMQKRHEEISTTDAFCKASKTQADMTLRVLRLLLRWKGLPAPIGKGIPARERNRRIIPDKAMPAFYRAVTGLKNGNVKDLLLFVLFSGIERKKSSELRWKDLDLAKRAVFVNGQVIPICSFLVGLLGNKERRDSEYIFPGRKKGVVQIYEQVGEIKRQMGFAFTVHDLRRTRLRQMACLGYCQARLNKLSFEETQDVAEKLSGKLLRLMLKQ